MSRLDFHLDYYVTQVWIGVKIMGDSEAVSNLFWMLW